MTVLKELPSRFRRQAKRYGVPGASIAILRGKRIVGTANAGITNVNTGIPVTDQTLFQIGSITKIMTTTLVMQLVEEGLLDLDQPVVNYLPGFRVADHHVSQSVTARQFLSHQSGIDGDFFVESGRGDDAGQKLLDMAAMMPSLYSPGEMLSYCNLGFVVLGRVIEVLTGKPWDDVLQERILSPLGMTNAFSRPEDGIRFSCAIGHLPSRKRPGQWNATRVPYLSQGQKAAGATPTMTATDLLKFARMHMDRGLAPDGGKILNARSVSAMQKRQIRVNPNTRSGLSGWGLGWMLFNYHGRKVFGHDGGTIGQSAFLRIVPDKGLAIAMLTNGGDTAGLYNEVFSELLQGLAKVDMPGFLTPDSTLKFNPGRYTGRYQNLSGLFEISERNEKLTLAWQPSDGSRTTMPEGTPLVPAEKDTFLLNMGNTIADRTSFLFSGFSDGKAQYLSMGTRQYRRVP